MQILLGVHIISDCRIIHLFCRQRGRADIAQQRLDRIGTLGCLVCRHAKLHQHIIDILKIHIHVFLRVFPLDILLSDQGVGIHHIHGVLARIRLILHDTVAADDTAKAKLTAQMCQRVHILPDRAGVANAVHMRLQRAKPRLIAVFYIGHALVHVLDLLLRAAFLIRFAV